MKSFMSSKILWSVVLWGIAVLILGGSWYRDIPLPFTQRRLLLPLVLLIKDILLYFVKFKSVKTISIDREKLGRDRDTGDIAWRYLLAVANRVYIFPIILTIYLLYLLISQTGVFDLDYSIIFLALDEQLLFIVTLISGGGIVFGQKHDAQYMRTTTSRSAIWRYILLSSVLGVVGAYIILQQTLSLGWLGVIIANIAGLLIFLVGVLLLEEQGQDLSRDATHVK